VKIPDITAGGANRTGENNERHQVRLDSDTWQTLATLAGCE
jgi:hypothetical protein